MRVREGACDARGTKTATSKAGSGVGLTAVYISINQWLRLFQSLPYSFHSDGWLRCMPITIVFSLRVVSYDCLALAPHGLIEVGTVPVYRDSKLAKY